jgi:hypothetical protein
VTADLNHEPLTDTSKKLAHAGVGCAPVMVILTYLACVPAGKLADCGEPVSEVLMRAVKDTPSVDVSTT